jgi:plastocyanin
MKVALMRRDHTSPGRRAHAIFARFGTSAPAACVSSNADAPARTTARRPRARQLVIRGPAAGAMAAMNRRPLALLTVSVVSAAALGGQVAASAATVRTVTLKNIAFSPKSLSISKGSTVRFAFRDGSTTHNVTSIGSRRFKTIGNRSSGSQSRTFTRAGTYRYECTLHPGMTGRISVH